MNVTCKCREFDLFLSWEHVTGTFDLLYYLVTISGIGSTKVYTTLLVVRVQPNIDYSVNVSTVSRCQQQSYPNMTRLSAEVTVMAGK